MTTLTVIERFRCGWCGSPGERTTMYRQPLPVDHMTVVVDMSASRFCDGCRKEALADMKRRMGQ